MKAKYIPNILSVIRLIMSFAFAAVFIWAPDRLWIAVVIFTLAGLTDVVDGILARRNNWITEAGKILDPLADKLMQCTALLCVVLRGLVPWWILVPIIFKELTMGVGSVIFYKMFKEIGVSKNYGKAYTVIFYVVIAAIIVFYDSWFKYNEWAIYALCIITALTGFAAIVMYYMSYLKGKLLKKNRKAEN